MLHRLIFNVLTAPSIHLCGSSNLIDPARHSCERRLLEVILRESGADDQFAFAKGAVGKGDQQGISYLGYKDRPEVHLHLQNIFTKHTDTHPQVNDQITATESGNIPSSRHLVPDLDQETFSSKFTPHCIVLLNGYPGVGKSTIGKGLQNVLHPMASTRLIENQLMIDRVEAIEPGQTQANESLLQDFRHVMFKRLRAIEDTNLVIIITVCLGTSSHDIHQFAEYQGLARDRGVLLYTINLKCDETTNAERLSNKERMDMDKTTLADAGVIFEFFSESST